LDDRMISVREATPEDGRALIDFLRMTPLSAGTEFVLDRSPDFSALLRLRGTSRTFLAVSHERLAGTVTALWHDARDGRGRCALARSWTCVLPSGRAEVARSRGCSAPHEMRSPKQASIGRRV